MQSIAHSKKFFYNNSNTILFLHFESRIGAPYLINLKKKYLSTFSTNSIILVLIEIPPVYKFYFDYILTSPVIILFIFIVSIHVAHPVLHSRMYIDGKFNK